MGLGSILGAITAPFTGPLGPLIGKGVDYLIGRQQSDDAFAQSASASALAYERDLDLYKKRYQYTVSDMKAAGLNPILAASGGFNIGNSPSYKAPQAFMAPATESMPSSARALKQAEESSANIERQGAEVKRVLEDAERIRSEKGLITAQEKETLTRIRNLLVEFDVLVEEVKTKKVNLNKMSHETWLLESQRKKVNAEVAKLRKIAKVYDGPAGQVIAYIETILGSIPGIGILLGKGIK